MTNIFKQVKYSKDNYRDGFLNLIPIGKLWTEQVENTASDVYLTADSFGEEFARIDERIHTLINEASPLTCVETIDDWERTYGLPVPSADTLIERKINLLMKILGSAIATEPSIKLIASYYGYDLVISRPIDLKIWTFATGRCGERKYNLNYNNYLIFELYGASKPDMEFEEMIAKIVLANLTIKFDWKI